jgi:hypothetical protein
VVVAVVFAGMYFLTAIPRVLYPYDLDIVEDGLLMEALRVADDQPIFVPPNADFIPDTYMPLYFWLGGALFKVTGPGFAPLRSVSLAAIVLTGGLIFWIARRESGRVWIAIVCTGLFLGGCRINGFSYELARVDALLIVLTLAGLALGVYGAGSDRGLILAAVSLALAFLTKQIGLLFGLVLAIYLALTIGRRARLFVMTFGLLTVGPWIGLNILSDGWFSYYTVVLAAAANRTEIGRLFDFVRFELLGLMAGLTLMALVAGLLSIRRAGSLRWALRDQPWLIWVAIAIAASALGRASVGGNLNTLMPAYTMLCLAPAVVFREWNARPDLLPRWRTGLLTLGILAQFALGVYNPLRYIPSPAMRQSGDRLIAKIRAIDGEVLVMMHPYYAWLAGKAPSAHAGRLWYVHQLGRRPLPPDFVVRVQSHYYAAIISDNSLFETESDLQQLLGAYYGPAEILQPDQAPATLTGIVIRPEVLYAPK